MKTLPSKSILLAVLKFTERVLTSITFTVISLRYRLDLGAELARRFCVSSNIICRIRKNKIWKVICN